MTAQKFMFASMYTRIFLVLNKFKIIRQNIKCNKNIQEFRILQGKIINQTEKRYTADMVLLPLAAL